MVYSSSDSFTFFWRPHEENGFLGQWFESQFEVGGERYSNAEQFMMAEKAREVNDSQQSSSLSADRVSHMV